MTNNMTHTHTQLAALLSSLDIYHAVVAVIDIVEINNL